MNNLTGNNTPSLYRWLCKFGTFFGLSVLWLLCCIPVLTIIPSCIALYDSVVHCVYGEQDSTMRYFFRAFKKVFLRGLCMSAMWIALGAALAFGFMIVNSFRDQGTLAEMYSWVYLATMVLPLGVLAWAIPLEARFQYTFFSLHKDAIACALINLPITVLLVFIFILVAAIILLLFPPLVLLLPGITVTVQCWLIERAFKRYPPEADPKEEPLSTAHK